MARIYIASILVVILAVGQSAELWSHRIKLSTGDGKNRRLQSTDGQSNPYVGFGMHFLQMYLGNPAQMRTLAVSTAGAFTALPCEDCEDCGSRGKNLFNFTGSKRFSVTQCSDCSQGSPCFNDRCAVGASTRDSSTWSGYEVSDVVFHGGGADQTSSIVGTDAAEMFGFPLRFVCQTRTRGFFNNVMDGVLGLSPAPTSFLSQMHVAGKLEHPRFSLCFNDVEYSNSETGTGVVTFGGFKQSFVETEMVYAKKLEGNVYRVNIKKIHLRVGGGRSVRPDAEEQQLVVAEPPGNIDTSAVVDSSSPFLTFDKRFEEPFRAAWREATGQEFTQARQTLTSEELAKMPTLLIELEGDPATPQELDPNTVPSLTSEFNVLVAVPAIHYLEHMVTAVRPYRARIHFDGERGSLLGANLMRGHTVSYEPDLARIGFAESSQCQTGGPGSGGRTGAGSGGDGGDEAGNVDADGSTSLATSGGNPQAPPSPASNAGSSVSVGSDDDLFVTSGESFQESKTEEGFDGGSCYTASCRSFMAIGYIFIGTALAVVYRVSRPKERLGSDLLQQYSVEEAQALHQLGDLSPAYRRKAWNDDGPVMV